MIDRVRNLHANMEIAVDKEGSIFTAMRSFLPGGGHTAPLCLNCGGNAFRHNKLPSLNMLSDTSTLLYFFRHLMDVSHCRYQMPRFITRGGVLLSVVCRRST